MLRTRVCSAKVRRLPRSVRSDSCDLQGLHSVGQTPLSLYEAYLDATDNLKGIPTAWETAKEIRARIHEETRLTASAGISCNKFLAKLASDYRKLYGQFAIMPDGAEAFVAILPVAKFHGVGPKTAAGMRALGIETGADLRRQTLSFLQDRSGKAGGWYHDIARGRDDRSVQPIAAAAVARLAGDRKIIRSLTLAILNGGRWSRCSIVAQLVRRWVDVRGTMALQQ
jgi:nucleotidyltransferase/DNA polymerase involved in DNA repair